MMNINVERRAEKLKVISNHLKSRGYSQDSDYRTAQKWWLSHNQAHLEKSMLPSTGIVIESVVEPIMMGWIYLSNSPIAQLSWVVSNPKTGPKTKYVALLILLFEAEKVARQSGYSQIQMFSDQSGLTKICEIGGYKKWKEHDFLIKRLDHSEQDDDV